MLIFFILGSDFYTLPYVCLCELELDEKKQSKGLLPWVSWTIQQRSCHTFLLITVSCHLLSPGSWLKIFYCLSRVLSLVFPQLDRLAPPTPYFQRNIFSIFGMLIAFRLIFKNHFTFFINVWGKRQFRISLGIELFYNPISVKFEIWQYLGRWRRSFTMDMWIFFKLFVFGI